MRTNRGDIWTARIDRPGPGSKCRTRGLRPGDWRTQIARSMRPVALALATWALARPALTRIPALMGGPALTGGLLTGSPALTGGAILAAQEPSPYLPLGHWATPYVEHLIATGVIADPAPLTRPIREADLVRALRAVDTTAARASVRATVRRLLAELERGNGAPRYYLAGDAGAAVATHALRDPLEIG